MHSGRSGYYWDFNKMGIPYFGIFWVKKILRLTNYGLFAEETFADLGKKTQTFTFFPESNL